MPHLYMLRHKSDCHDRPFAQPQAIGRHTKDTMLPATALHKNFHFSDTNPKSGLASQQNPAPPSWSNCAYLRDDASSKMPVGPRRRPADTGGHPKAMRWRSQALTRERDERDARDAHEQADRREHAAAAGAELATEHEADKECNDSWECADDREG